MEIKKFGILEFFQIMTYVKPKELGPVGAAGWGGGLYLDPPLELKSF